jgi:S1-C subfamily serine protease
MKTNSNIKRLSALLLAGSIAVATATASAATTTAMNTRTSTACTAMHTTGKRVAKHGHGWLGAIAKDSHAPADRIHRTAPDVRLLTVFPGSPAYRAGLRSGDVIWKFDGTRLRSTAQLKDELRHEKAGDVVPVEIFHHGQRKELKVRLGAAHMQPRGTGVSTIG